MPVSSSTTTLELPHDLLAEKSLIGCLMIDNDAYNDIVDLSLKREDFYNPQYRVVFECIQDLVLANRPVDYVTVCSRLSDLGKMETLGQEELRGQAFILNLIEEQASSANIYHYAKTVKDKAILRSVIKTANKVVSAASSFSGNDCRSFISDVEADFFKITQDIRSSGIKKLSACLTENLQDLESGQRHLGEISGLSTGFDKLDSFLLGLQPGQLIILAARPAMGKTALAINVAVNAVKRSGLPAMIYSLEMMSSELSLRILSSNAQVEFKKLRSKNLNENELKKIGRTIQQISSLPIFITDDGNATVLDIQSECRKIKAEYGLGIVVVDYVQLLRPHTKNPSREQQIAEISRHLKMLAKELACPVIALSQLNRGVEARVDKRPLVSDLRESGSLEQDADVVLLIYRDDFYFPDTSKEKGVAEVIIGKNRSGESGTVKLAFHGPYTTFAPLAHDPYADMGGQGQQHYNPHAHTNSNTPTMDTVDFFEA
ncbi:MAG: replicative DNA helicase [Oligoflexia bacterium]|nr:replicative DNA helicase [Oligoflexia bacterium]MBF0366018.1 replicative DNA helicase [Oligoflexia bacterium]